MREKVDPYLRPIYDALYELKPRDTVDKKIMSEELKKSPQKTEKMPEQESKNKMLNN